MKTSNTAHLGQLTEFFIEFLLFIYGLPTLKHMKMEKFWSNGGA
jgi:hypothetical protein